ncbi:nitrate ABC transporter [Aliidiomarina iranensis]|uniref:Nitrate ABC transporter n=1 Tax=Aliidiomarina iranensis TaxID=1434071 RepID=A0A432W2J6_9GAMM|nr:ABC transporter substrate-binding protein [Aliidiomarina iranensis]RUO23451.1 nitrate ABC transporter [Aliidiomarina iranensis]
MVRAVVQFLLLMGNKVAQARAVLSRFRVRLSFLVLALAAASLLTACTPMREPVNIAGNQWLGYHPLYLAHTQNCVQCPFSNEYYGERPIKVNMLADTTLVSRLFANGQLDGALVTLDEAIRLQSNNQMDLCVARILSFSQGADAVLLAPHAELSQRPLRVGYEETALGAFLLQRAIQFLGLNENDLQPELVLPSQHLQSVLSGDVDMLITYEPFITQLKSQGATVLFDSSQIPHEILDLFVVRRDVWQEHAKMLDWVASELWEKGRVKLSAPSSADATFMQETLALNSEELSNALSGLHFPDYQENREIQATELDAILARLNGHLLSSGLISTPAHLPSCYEL